MKAAEDFLEFQESASRSMHRSAIRMCSKTNGGRLGLEPADLMQEGLAAVWKFWGAYSRKHSVDNLRRISLKVYHDAVQDVLKKSFRKMALFGYTSDDPVWNADRQRKHPRDWLDVNKIGTSHWAEALIDLKTSLPALELQALTAITNPLTDGERARFNGHAAFEGKGKTPILSSAIFLVQNRLGWPRKQAKEAVENIYGTIKKFARKPRWTRYSKTEAAPQEHYRQGQEPRKMKEVSMSNVMVDPLEGLEAAPPARRKAAPPAAKAKVAPAAAAKGNGKVLAKVAAKVAAKPAPAAKAVAKPAAKVAAKPAAKAAKAPAAPRASSNAAFKATAEGLETPKANSVPAVICKTIGTLVKGMTVDTLVEKLAAAEWEPPHGADAYASNPRGYLSGYVSFCKKQGWLAAVA